MKTTKTLEKALWDTHGSASWLLRLLTLGILVDIAGILTGFGRMSLLQRASSGWTITEESVASIDAMYSLVGSSQLIVFLVTVVLWLLWMRRAYENLRLVGTEETRFSPGWAVGYWFIPFVNLVRPYQIITETWRRSETQNDAEVVAEPTSLTGWWWGIFLASNFVGRLAMTQAQSVASIGDAIGFTRTATLSDALTIVAAVLALKVVSGIDERQQKWEVERVATPVPVTA